MNSFHLAEDITKENLNKKAFQVIPKSSYILPLETKYVKQYLGFCSIECDFELILEITHKLCDFKIKEQDSFSPLHFIDDRNLLIKRALFTTLIITYAKCFNSNKENRASLNEDFISKNFPEHPSISKENALLFHRNLLQLRNKYVAHSGNSNFDSITGFMQFGFDVNDLTIKVNYVNTAFYGFNQTELENLLVLTSFLLKKVGEKKEFLSQKIVESFSKEEIFNIGLNAILNNS